MPLELIWMTLLKRRMLDSTGAVGNIFIAPNVGRNNELKK